MAFLNVKDIDDNLKENFAVACIRNHTSQSDAIRDFMREYVEKIARQPPSAGQPASRFVDVTKTATGPTT